MSIAAQRIASAAQAGNVRRIEQGWAGVKAKLSPRLRLIEERIDGGAFVVDGGLRLIVSVEVHDGRLWAHVSASYAQALPGWAVMKRVKRLTLGAGAKAIMVLPPEAEHVNINTFVHHLWSCLDGDVLPDFTFGSGEI